MSTTGIKNLSISQIPGVFDFNDNALIQQKGFFLKLYTSLKKRKKITYQFELTNTTLQTPQWYTHIQTLFWPFLSFVLSSQYSTHRPLTSGTAIIFWVTMLSRIKENATWSSSSSKGLIAFSKRANLSSFWHETKQRKHKGFPEV